MIAYQYFAFGLGIQSEFQINAFQALSSLNSFSLYIRINKEIAPDFQFDDRLVVREETNLGYSIAVKDIAAFDIFNGSIQINPFTSDSTLIESALLNEALPAFLSLRNKIVLTGSAVLFRNKAYLVLGEAGIGKSSLMANFDQKGYSILSDQQCILGFERGQLEFTPDALKLKLWEDCLDALSIKTDHLQKVRKGINKYFYTPLNLPQKDSFEIGGIIVLALINSNTESLQSKVLNHLDALKEIKTLQLNSFYLSTKNQQSRDFELITQLSSSYRCIKVSRSEAIFNIEKHSKFVEHCILNHEKHHLA